ncbi:DUF3419 family protein [Portibacter marinus]|uniref:DUF3419 family protein n=1 Tax=Portibacter marinus TaxID=2898660 RepID=UPI001F3FE175|nr:DUF3419 family protein [Portibacter marinus]
MTQRNKHLEKVDHSIIRYANVWEDPVLLIEGLDIRPGHKVLSIASAGDNALALATQMPELIVAADVNLSQLYLTEIKKVAIQNLEREEFLSFIGFTPPLENRLNCFKGFKNQLSNSARAFWEDHGSIIEDGIIYQGKFEKYLMTFAHKILPLIHSAKLTQELFAPKSSVEQRKFYDEKWNTLKWRWFFRFFFNKQVMGLLGRDRAFLRQVEVHVSKTILAKAGQHLSSDYAQSNSMLHFCLKGNFDDALPYYAREDNYELVKQNLDVIQTEHCYVQDASVKYGKFDRFNLSNIFEYMSSDIFQYTAQALLESANTGARFAYWNLLVERVMSNVVYGMNRLPDREKWSERDQGFFYMQFVLEQIVR